MLARAASTMSICLGVRIRAWRGVGVPTPAPGDVGPRDTRRMAAGDRGVAPVCRSAGFVRIPLMTMWLTTVLRRSRYWFLAFMMASSSAAFNPSFCSPWMSSSVFIQAPCRILRRGMTKNMTKM